MTEQPLEDHDRAADPALRTGNLRVDAVLDSLAGLDGQPLSEHVTVFERAHEQLRVALEAQPEAQPGV
ncbi:MAG TPA: hypothetical protein PLP61_09615 [Nocardioides sp.]|uniref:hypothetical protein n=1 Tax=Nocardioides sp. TaxID=35761 RepID=UPI002CB1235C|nr:hypothetical protein [Nocardioides sp.]HQR27283.1 hypothetical protein [Nocardioides sp.]